MPDYLCQSIDEKAYLGGLKGEGDLIGRDRFKCPLEIDDRRQNISWKDAVTLNEWNRHPDEFETAHSFRAKIDVPSDTI